MGWDGTIKPPSHHRNRIEERERGSKEREAPQNNCVLYLFHFHPVGESRWEKEREEEIGETLLEEESGIWEGGRHSKQRRLAGSSSHGVEGQECSTFETITHNTTRLDTSKRRAGQGEAHTFWREGEQEHRAHHTTGHRNTTLGGAWRMSQQQQQR